MNITFGLLAIALGFGIPFLASTLIERFVRQERVIVAEAGKTDLGTQREYYPYTYLPHLTIQSKNGVDVEDGNMSRVLVHGYCMSQRGIPNGSQLYVRNIDTKMPISKQIKHNDILLIYLEDKKMFKLRVFDNYGENGCLLTYRFDPETGKRINSTHPHTPESVQGVVQYTVKNNILTDWKGVTV